MSDNDPRVLAIAGLKALSNGGVNIALLSEELEDLDLKSDTHAVIDAGKVLDETLALALKHIPGSKRATFDERIKRAATSGLLQPPLASDLEIIRHIRNPFSHRMEVRSLTEPRVAMACATLQMSRLAADQNQLRSLEPRLMPATPESVLWRSNGQMVPVGQGYMVLTDSDNRCAGWIRTPTGKDDPRSLFIESTRVCFYFLIVAAASNL